MSVRMCVGAYQVPFMQTNTTFDLVDPYNLAGELGLEDQAHGLSILDFKGSCNIKWLEKGLQLSHRWWKSNASDVPLLKEVLERIDAKKKRKAFEHRLQASVVPLRIRGKVLLFQNHSHAVRLALRQDQGKEDLEWFLGELRKDIDIAKGPAEPDGAPKKKRKLNVSTDIQDIASEILQSLHALDNCKSASYLASRKALLVTRKKACLAV